MSHDSRLSQCADRARSAGIGVPRGLFFACGISLPIWALIGWLAL